MLREILLSIMTTSNLLSIKKDEAKKKNKLLTFVRNLFVKNSKKDRVKILRSKSIAHQIKAFLILFGNVSRQG